MQWHAGTMRSAGHVPHATVRAAGAGLLHRHLVIDQRVASGKYAAVRRNCQNLIWCSCRRIHFLGPVRCLGLTQVICCGSLYQSGWDCRTVWGVLPVSSRFCSKLNGPTNTLTYGTFWWRLHILTYDTCWLMTHFDDDYTCWLMTHVDLWHILMTITYFDLWHTLTYDTCWLMTHVDDDYTFDLWHVDLWHMLTYDTCWWQLHISSHFRWYRCTWRGRRLRLLFLVGLWLDSTGSLCLCHALSGSSSSSRRDKCPSGSTTPSDITSCKVLLVQLLLAASQYYVRRCGLYLPTE